MKELKILLENHELENLKSVFNTSNETDAVKAAIQNILKKQAYDQILSLRGNVKWEGNLDEMRETAI